MVVSAEKRELEFGGAKFAPEMQTKILFRKWRERPAIIFDTAIFLESRAARCQPFERRLDRLVLPDRPSSIGGGILRNG